MLTLWAAVPFALTLIAVAVMPLVRREWWDRWYPLAVMVLALPVLFSYLAVQRDFAPVLGVLHEYFSFIALIGSLYIIAGGIRLRIVGTPRPLFNVAILVAGALIANVIGTTGASMLFIRSYLNANRYRYQPYLLVFFIFIVANIGGCLTPIGDPPLFLGYVNGVPFFWVIGQVWYLWLAAMILVLAMFYRLDRRNQAGCSGCVRPVRVHLAGRRNLILLGIVLVAVFAQTPVRELVMIGAAAASYFFARPGLHHRNRFNFKPIVEVAILFAGIFITMAPVLELLETHAAQLGLRSAGSFYWLTGLLSSTLDNAPTYRTFLEAAISLGGGTVSDLLATSPQLVRAISVGAVFFGAMTYIGNGPNFMIKSMAEHRHLEVPHFFEYIYRYSLPILLPVFIVIWLLLLIP